MSDYQQQFSGEKRNAPIWQVFAVVIVLMALSAGSFYYGSQNPSSGISGGSSFGTDYGSDGSTDYQTDQGTEYFDDGSSGYGSQVETYILSSYLGFGSTSVEQALRSSGFVVFTRYTTGDPSINARMNNGCPVVDQSPAAGSEVYAGSTITILADCPMTGQW